MVSLYLSYSLITAIYVVLKLEHTDLFHELV